MNNFSIEGVSFSMLRILINFYGSANLRELRFNKDTFAKVTVECLKSYLPDEKCELLLLKINNISTNIIMQDKKTIDFYVKSCTQGIDGHSDSASLTINDVDVIRILGYTPYIQTSPNDQSQVKNQLNAKSIESFAERLKIHSNGPLMRESMRLKDIKMMKFTRRDEEAYLKYLQVEKPSKNFPTILSNIIFNTIPEDPLPFIF